MTQGYLWVDIEGLSLTPEDKEILAHPAVSGVILFSRNYTSREQLLALTSEINRLFPSHVITVDQEGGRVQRFREGFTLLPSMESWGEQFLANPEEAKRGFSSMLSTMIHELQAVGIDSSLVPVLDINYGKNAVIGHRSFGAEPSLVSALGAWMIQECHRLRMPVTGKHFPGHGYVVADSHLELPEDCRSKEAVFSADLMPFKTLSASMDAIMLAHVVYAAIDPNPVCFSHYWIQSVLRKSLRFEGLVITDDLSMQAVAQMGSYADRGARALEAGCDILLVCNARAGVIDILDHVPYVASDQRAVRLQQYRRYKS